MTDTERLSWLENHPEFRLVKTKRHWSCAKPTSYEYTVYKTIREAIDAAMDGSWQDD
jgi:hypothetical protein